jgi:hypothetical protein
MSRQLSPVQVELSMSARSTEHAAMALAATSSAKETWTQRIVTGA